MRVQHSEKRIEDRRKLDIYMNKLIGDEPYMVRTSNISVNGLYLNNLIEPDLDEGTNVSLEFRLPNSDEIIWARGTIMRDAQRWGTKGIGIWFTILPKYFRTLIEEYVYSV
jgi:hypothetical protein